MTMFMKVGQAAKALQVSPGKITQYIRDNRLRAVNVGTAGKRAQWRIHPDDLRNILPAEETRTTRRYSHPDIRI